MDDDELEWLLALDGASFEAAAGHVVEFTVNRTAKSGRHPHGIVYALVFRPADGPPYVRFDNAHPAGGGRMRRKGEAFDHWHRTDTDPGRVYKFENAAKLLDDFWREVRRVMDEKGIAHEL